MYLCKYATNPMFKYIIITTFKQSAKKRTTESYRFMMEYQMVKINMNNLMVEITSNLKVMK